MLYIIPMRSIKKITKIYTKKMRRESKQTNKKNQLNRKENKAGGTKECKIYRKQIAKEAELSLCLSVMTLNANKLNSP